MFHYTKIILYFCIKGMDNASNQWLFDKLKINRTHVSHYIHTVEECGKFD